MPKWIGDLSEKAFKSYYRPVIVTDIEYYDRLLKRVRFQGEALKGVDWKPAQEVEFRVTETDFRHYTPLCWNDTEGYTDVLFYLHSQGPGSAWADRVESGLEINLIGPGGKFVLPPDRDNVAMLGDETTLSAFKSMRDVLPNDACAYCILEMEAYAHDWPSRIGLEAAVLQTKHGHRGQVLEDWLNGFLKKGGDGASFFLSGNAGTIKRLRRQLLAKKIPPGNIFSKPYWMEGRQGL